MGCSPQSAQYIQPTTKSGILCVNQCQQTQIKCETNYDQNYQHCLSQVEAKATSHYQILLAQYETQEQNHAAHIKTYQQEIQAWQRKTNSLNQQYITKSEQCANGINPKESCQKAQTLAETIDTHYQNKPTKPMQQEKPSLSIERSTVKQSCQDELDCQQLYDECFTACGGKINQKP